MLQLASRCVVLVQTGTPHTHYIRSGICTYSYYVPMYVCVRIYIHIRMYTCRYRFFCLGAVLFLFVDICTLYR